MILSFIAIFLSQSLSAQNVTVSGKIKDTMGEPLAGVTVIVKGSTHGTISNVDGNFTIGNIASNDILVFSFIGMKTEEIEVKGKKIIDVIMTENVTVLDEVVAVGYGTVRKVDLTGSVSVYQGDDI